ncbi:MULTISPECIES: holin family protein [Brevibacillus]|uniref:Phage holin family protein n=1 Tax=Brevibacillus laterosporus TaxID=1465 RepID=A0AAP3DMK4_BRELA|nr:MULTISPECIES: phage holin family protein [Brevibacillus]MCR8983119.1 phage holin family protein [Brevibacillus laterosporus]MCZ0810275.1 phage holin family protein [Brevibacillus laterosporus]MCZ0828553.1 phage holin family protein [Brevibacillus laterosporus]MCZ0852941.1 phage holin family protein [Brevibacillus laterosporus]RFB28392.1 holin [Brevibacillus sp. VP]
MENVFKTLVAIGGGALSLLFGGWSRLLTILIVFVIIDYASGVAAGSVEGKLKSKIGLIGIARKVFIFAMVAVAHLIDTALGDQHVFRNATIFFYLANEALSIIENTGRIGLPVPEVIKKAVDVLKDKGGAK